MRTEERVSISAFVDPDDFERLASAHELEERSMSAEIRLALREHLHRLPSGDLRRALAFRPAADIEGRMSLLGRIGLSPESAALEGTPEEVDARMRAAHDEKLRPARVEAARRIRGWHEITDDLVPRLGGRWLVSAGMDLIYAPYRGVVWAADTAVAIADTTELAFVVDDDLKLHFYERICGRRRGRSTSAGRPRRSTRRVRLGRRQSG